MKLRLIIADENPSYIKALARYLQEEHGQAIEAACFTQRHALVEYLEKADADILLIDQKLQGVSYHTDHIKAVITLIDDMQINDAGIYKFQKADKIVRQLLELYEKLAGGCAGYIKQNNESKLICVYSPAGGSGKTTIAYNLAYQYAIQTQRVLFISLEAYTALSVINGNESVRGLVYLLYLIKSNMPHLQLKLDTIKIIDPNTNIHFLEREGNVLEYKDIKLEDMQLLLDFFRYHSGYDVVIFDLDSTVNEIALGAFKYCDAIVNVICRQSSNSAKQREFINQVPQINNLLDTDICSKLISVINKHNDAEAVAATEANNCFSQMMMPYINGLSINQDSYFEGIAYFKQLYDLLNNFFQKGEGI